MELPNAECFCYVAKQSTLVENAGTCIFTFGHHREQTTHVVDERPTDIGRFELGCCRCMLYASTYHSIRTHTLIGRCDFGGIC